MSDVFVGRAVKRNEKRVFDRFVRLRIIEIIETQSRRMRRKICVRARNTARTISNGGRLFQFIRRRVVEIDFAVRLITRSPAVICAVFERVKCFVGFVQTEMIRTLIGRQQRFCRSISDRPRCANLWQKFAGPLPSAFISIIAARSFSFSSQALQLEPTET